jgi:hypothetical protein
MEESEQIVIVYNYWTEFADEEEDVYPDDELSTCSGSVARVGETNFRITWYTSLAITGPWGPTLNLGDIIEVRPLSDGTYRYLGTSEKNDRIGNITWPVRMEIFNRLDASWKTRIISALKADEPPQQENHQQGERLQRAVENLRKQHKWGDISDEEYRSERNVLMRQLKLLDAAVKPHPLPNLERSAEFLQDLPRLWLHPGVTHEEREALVKQVFQRITIDGKDFVDLEPKPEYTPPSPLW